MSLTRLTSSGGGDRRTHRLAQVPGRVVLLLVGQAEGGVQNRVVHEVVDQSVGFWVKTLSRREQRVRIRVNLT